MAGLDPRERLDRLRLIRTPRIGPATFHDLLRRFGRARDAIEALPELARTARASLKLATVADAERELELAGRNGAEMVLWGEPGYPAALAAADTPPPVLFFRGASSTLDKPAVAIVGARNASAAGSRFARLLAADLGAGGLFVVSGLARGIDAAAHAGALETGTIAVLAGGLSRPYPPENVPLMERIAAEGGAVLSEMPWGWEPRAQDFPRRNRIVAGLGLGLVVVEAALRSGSLISARLAGELGRLVFAVPGSPLDPRAEGTNRLLKQGATLVTSASDVLDEIAPLLGRAQAASIPALQEDPPGLDAIDGSDRARVANALSPTPISLDELAAHTGLSSSQLSLALLELDLSGRIERHSGGAVSICARP